MRILIETTGLHKEMPSAEVLAVGGGIPIEERGKLFVVDVTQWEPLKRLGYSARIMEFLGKSAFNELPFAPQHVVEGRYAIRALNAGFKGNTEALRESLYELVWSSLSAPQVDLKNPQTVLYAYMTPKEVWWGRLLHEFGADAFAQRDSKHRVFKRAVEMQPRKARCLVNLSRVQPGERMLDPFCGTGSFLIEAASMGVQAYGGDVDGEMVSGAKRNAAHLGLAADVRHIDGRLTSGWGVKFDAIVTDLPYGRSASLKKVKMAELYKDFLESAWGVLGPDKYAVVLAPKGKLKVPPKLFAKVSAFDEYVHGSLTRQIFVLHKKD
ncbi:MAG: methyltransferase domain-containing protein [Candidatus Aenigmatarchaeota archaeon]|nr:MAG: methyltransferase domain-containing protein [Candidatus Aenigmarchaeota archaeon]